MENGEFRVLRTAILLRSDVVIAPYNGRGQRPPQFIIYHLSFIIQLSFHIIRIVAFESDFCEYGFLFLTHMYFLNTAVFVVVAEQVEH